MYLLWWFSLCIFYQLIKCWFILNAKSSDYACLVRTRSCSIDFLKILLKKFSMTKNKNAERKGFQAFSQRWLNNKPPMVRPSRPIKFVPTVPNFPGPWLTCLQMDPEMNLGSFYKCSYTWNFYGVCMIVSVWLFQILKASKYSLSGSFLVWDSDSLSSWNENGSTLLRDWLRRRPTLNDMVRHHFFHHHTRHTALKTEH